MSHGHSRKQGGDQRHTHVALKLQQNQQEIAGSEELETRQSGTTPAPGLAAEENPRREDEQDGDTTISEGDDDVAPAGGEPDEQSRSWARDTLLRSRVPVVVVRLVKNGDAADAVPTFIPRSAKAVQMLAHLCDFLRDRFGPNGREAIPDATEWAKLIGDAPARLTERLGLLARLAVTGQHKYERTTGGNSRGSDLGLGHFAYKFAALPDGTAFSVGLLLAGGKSGAKGTADEPGLAFDRLPVGVRLLALKAALRRERDEKWVRDDEAFRGLLRDEAARLLGGASLPAIPVTGLRRYREWLTKNGHGDLFPKASERKQAT